MREPRYLGDGLYVEDHGHQFCLYASNGISRTNEVFLDASMLKSLNEWVDQ